MTVKNVIFNHILISSGKNIICSVSHCVLYKTNEEVCSFDNSKTLTTFDYKSAIYSAQVATKR